MGGAEPARFAIGGVVLVGRRIREPLWRGLSFFQRTLRSSLEEKRAQSKEGKKALLDLVSQAKF